MQGDSGGPLTYKQGDQHILIGVTSHGTGPNEGCGATSNFARISLYRKWIDENIDTNNDSEYCDDYEAPDDEP